MHVLHINIMPVNRLWQEELKNFNKKCAGLCIHISSGVKPRSCIIMKHKNIDFNNLNLQDNTSLV